MSWPPMLIHIKIHNPRTNLGFWVPLFLFYPIVLAILLALSPFFLIALLVIWLMGYGNWLLFTLKTSFTMFWSLRGLKLDVQGQKETIQISIV